MGAIVFKRRDGTEVDPKRLDTLLNGLREDKVRLFSVEDVSKRVGLGPKSASKVASKLVARGHAIRLSAGLYELAPTKGTSGISPREHISTVLNWIGGTKGCWLSHGSAMSAHGLPPPLPHSTLILSSKVVLRPRQILPGIRVHFLRASARGRTRKLVELNVPGMGKVSVTDEQTTLLDSLALTRYSGDIFQVARFLGLVKSRLDVDSLCSVAARHSGAVARRLSYLLELAGFGGNAQLAKLQSSLTSTIVLLDPTGPAEGRQSWEWGLRFNRSHEQIRQALAGN
jgi:predicted transcriptional regulator of viral defense system